MSRFNHPNLFRFGYNLNWKYNLINISTYDWKRFLFEYNMLEKVLLKHNFIILRSFFNQEVFKHYLLVYKAKSHRIFRKKKNTKRVTTKRVYFVDRGLLSYKRLKKFLFQFFFLKFIRVFFFFKCFRG